MKNATLIALCILFGAYCTAQDLDIGDISQSSRLIPVIDYIPIDFDSKVANFFDLNASRPCYFVRKATGSYDFYRYNHFSIKRTDRDILQSISTRVFSK